MGWTIPWVSSADSDFNEDFGVSTPKGETFGLSVFLRDGQDVYRTYFTSGRGVEALGSVWTFPDLTARPPGGLEDSPPGRPQGPRYSWWSRRDEYGDTEGPHGELDWAWAKDEERWRELFAMLDSVDT